MMSDSDDELPPMAVPLVVAPRPAPTETAAACATSEGKNFSAPLPPPVPVLLLTGFLGAGKTTLVNFILTERHGYRCAVLLNEFADSADIEKALVRDPEEGSMASPLNSWVQLENGCICCSVKNDMVQALEALMQQRDRFDYVIIETTGLANPGPVAAALWTDAELECSICLDAIVTVVDAKNVRRHLQESRPAGAINEAQQQVAFADVVLLNKVDLVQESDLQAVESAITGINAEAEVVRCERCVVDLGRILHTGSYTGGGVEHGGEERNGKEEIGELNAENSGPHAHGADAEHGHCSAAGCTHPAHAHSHDPGIRTVTLRADRPLSLQRVRHWLDELLWEREREGGEAPDIFRAKGLLHVEGSDRKWVLQAVHELYDVVQGPEWEPAGTASMRSKLIFIGRHLDGERLQRELNACCGSS